MPMRITPESDTSTLVLIGSFSPKMFHPLWFEARGFIGKQEAANAQVALLHEELTHFTTPRGITIDVQPQRFAIGSEAIPEDVRDIAVGLFGGPLAGIPIQAVGINRTVHFNTGSPDLQHKIGLALAPRDPWGSWGKKMSEGENMSNRSGLLSLKMQQNRKKDEPRGWVQVRVEPSAMFRMTGIFMEINNHYTTLSDPPEAGDASAALAVISEQWTAANACADEIFDQIMAIARP